MKHGMKRVVLTAALAIWMTCFGELQAFADVTGITVQAGETCAVEAEAEAAGEEPQEEPEEEPAEEITEEPVEEITEEEPT